VGEDFNIRILGRQQNIHSSGYGIERKRIDGLFV
jgi:hypothetical protein